MLLYTQDLNYKLSKENKEWAPKYITNLWDTWHEDRQEVSDINNRILKYVLPKSDSAKAKFEQLTDLYECYMAFKANLRKDFFKNYESLFDARGRTYQDNQNATLQKDAILDNMEDFNFELSLYDIGDEFIKNGEVTVFCYWDEVRQQRIYKKTESEMRDEKSALIQEAVAQGMAPSFELLNSVQEVETEEIVECSGVNTKVIKADSFVYDVNQARNWKRCPKIIREFLTYQEIVSDEFYQEYLTKSIKEELRRVSKESNPTDRNDEIYREKDKQRGYKGLIEVLEYWGDITLKDGTLLENYLITVVNGKYILRFEPNPYLDCPIIHSTYLQHAELKRGISLLCVALVLAEVSDEILKAQLEGLKFIINPPFIGPEGAIKPQNSNGTTKLIPGGYIGYDSEVMDRPPTPMTHFKDVNFGFQYLQIFEQKIESGTGIFKNMSGDPTGKERTATEVVEVSGGANIRLNDIVAYLNTTIKIPVIKCIATLLSNFKTEPEEVNTQSSQYQNYATIDQSVRSGKYKYRISGNDETAYQRQIFKEALPVLSQIFADPAIKAAIRPDEFVKWIFENLAVKNPERLIDFQKLNQPQQDPGQQEMQVQQQQQEMKMQQQEMQMQGQAKQQELQQTQGEQQMLMDQQKHMTQMEMMRQKHQMQMEHIKQKHQVAGRKRNAA